MRLDKLVDTKVSTKLTISFSLITILTLVLGIISVFGLIELSKLTENMYKHPFAVSNAVRDINSNIIAMHRSMKDVALSQNEKELEAAISKVDKLEQHVIKNFDTVFERFLGDASDVREKYDTFIKWKVIRDEVIVLVRNDQKSEAAEITKYKGAAYVNRLTEEMNHLIVFANNKADEFFTNAKKEKQRAILILVILLILILIVSVLISKKITKNITYAIDILSNGINDFFSFLGGESQEIKYIKYKNNDEFGKMISRVNENIGVSSKLHTEINNLMLAVDKNIILSKTNPYGIITYVSEAFVSISGYSKEELIGKSHNIVRHPDSEKEKFKELWKTIESGNIWKGEIKNLKKDGDFYWIDVVITPEFDIDNKIIAYSALRQDITAKKALEELSSSLELKVEERTQELYITNKKITDSIEYASLIQHSLIPEQDIFSKYFQDSFAIWHPKDIVGGDIYLMEEISEDEVLLMVIDCTGHGVPGAFVTMLVKAIEREIIASIHITEHKSPSKILSIFNKSIKNILKQEDTKSISNAGFDGAIVYYNKKDKIIRYAGSNTPFYYYQDKKMNMIKGDRHSIGYKKSDANYEFKEHEIDVSQETQVFISTDGYFDQCGGEKDFPFGKKNFVKLLEENVDKSMTDKQKILLSELNKYEADRDRNDDVTVVGFKI